jgi:Mrp family chromosome partitioning ATPase
MKRTVHKDDGIFNLVQRLDRTLNLSQGRIVTFISARPGEGTTTIARDYVRGLSDMVDHKILLIDAGPLDQSYYDTHNADPTITIADTLAEEKELDEALYSIGETVFLGRWMKEENGRGRSRSSALKLVNDDKFWKALRKSFGTVVIDAPSLKESGDSIGLAVRADAVALVVEAETTRQPVIENLRDTLNSAGAKIAGVVMNKRRFYIPEKVYEKM